MAQRLRLYFGSGRSNTAPEILEEASEEHRLPGQCDPDSSALVQDETSSENSATTILQGHVEPSLKRSSSMFIPQLSSCSETRPTKSSSMHISLQRANGFNNEDSNIIANDDIPPPSYRPPSPAPSYYEAQNQDIPLQPPPPYCNPEPNSSTGKLNLPKRRVFSIDSNGYTLYSRGQPGISVGGICIQRKSPDGSEIQHVRILPYGGAGWCMQQADHKSCASGEPHRVVFQLQPNQSQTDNQAWQQKSTAHFTTTKGNRIVRYPKIRLERSSSYPRLYQHQLTGGDNKVSQSGSEAQQTEMKNRTNGCVFNLSADSPRSKPRVKIFFNNGGGDQNVLDNSSSTRNDTKVNNCVLHFFKILT